MNRDQVQGNWSVLKAKLRGKWGKLTDGEIGRFEGQRKQLLGRIQKLYSDSRETIEAELERMEKSGAGANP